MRSAVILGALAVLLQGAAGASAARPQREPLHERTGKFLTGPSERRPADRRARLRERPHRDLRPRPGDLDGLRLTRAYRWGTGAVHLQWEQVYRGIPVFGPGLRANVDAQGRLINVGAGAQPDPHVPSIVPRLPAPKGERATLTIFGDRLAWRVLVRADPTHVYDTVVDATTGETLYRVNLVRAATARVFDNYPGAPHWRRPGRPGLLGDRRRPVVDGRRPPCRRQRPRVLGPRRRHRRVPAGRPEPAPADEIPPSAPGAVALRPGRRAGHLGPALPVGRAAPGTASARRLQLDRQPGAGRHPALLLREPLPRPPARRARHRLRRRLGQLRGRRPRRRPGRRRRDHGRWAEPACYHAQQRLRHPRAGRHATGDAALPVVQLLLRPDRRLPTSTPPTTR